MQIQKNRRQFLKELMTIGIAAPSLAVSQASHGFLPSSWFSESEHWLSAQGSQVGNYGLGVINQEKSLSIDSKFRGHGLCQNPKLQHQVVMFSRRPGTTGLVLNINTMKTEQTFECEANHHMHGHGCFSHDGLFLFTAESNYKTGQGIISVRDCKNFNVIKRISSHGIGPHEIALMPDKKTLVIANGGLLTHPDSGREILNLDTMSSNLSLVNWHTGELVNQFTAPEKKASIRHLDVASDGTIAFAMQAQRSAITHGNLVPLAAIVKPQDNNISLLSIPAPVHLKLDDYIGSIRLNKESNTLAMTSPKGDIALFYDLNSTELKATHTFHDVCGLTISSNQKHYVLSNSAGKIRHIDSQNFKEAKEKRLHFPNHQWDNHMITLANL